MGYWMLHDWARAMPAGYFVVTSNVDGHFEEAGFPTERILEQHGSLHRYQCTVPCSEALWQDDPPDLNIDLEALRARGSLPRCPECGVVARPNVMMFGDVRWVAGATKVQQQRYAKWLASVRGTRLAAERDRTTLVRINPDATDADEPVVPIRMGALEALTRIEERLPEGRCVGRHGRAQ
jgi:NAD-dependent SIR2 family protein deacetylase